MKKIKWKDWRVLSVLVIGMIALCWWLKYELVDRPAWRAEWSKNYDREAAGKTAKKARMKKEVVLKLRTCVGNLKESKSDVAAYYDLKKMKELIDQYENEIRGSVTYPAGLNYHLEKVEGNEIDYKKVISEFQDLADELEAELR